MITTRIFDALQNATVCVADLSSLNANVFYELGIRHSFRKPVMHIAQEGTPLPFDNAQHDTHFYDLGEYGAMTTLQAWIARQFEYALDTNNAVTNPLTAALGTIQLGISADPRDQVIKNLSERVTSLERHDLANTGSITRVNHPDGWSIFGKKSPRQTIVNNIAELLSNDAVPFRLLPEDLEGLIKELHWADQETIVSTYKMLMKSGKITNIGEVHNTFQMNWPGILQF